MTRAEQILKLKPSYFSGASYYYNGVSRVRALEAMKEIAWEAYRKGSLLRYISLKDADKRNTRFFEKWYNEQIKEGTK